MRRCLRRTRGSLVAAILALVVMAAGCSGAGGDESGAAPSSSPSTTTPTASATPQAAPAVPRPRDRACYRMPYADALAPTTSARSVACDSRHTTLTFAVGELDTVVDGHLLAVDSDRVQAQVARTCPEQVSGFLGGTQDDLRLSMLRAVWFTPTVKQSDAGADWYRCDVVALASQGELAPLTGRMQGVLGTDGRDQYAMCGTAEPGTAAFRRVICSAGHSWRALSVVDLPDGDYPGEDAARAAGQTPCEDAGRAAASDALDFSWGYEWPTREQWRGGQTYGLCWAPDGA